MSQTPQDFSWYDVMTTDVAASKAFYEHVVGWTIADSGMPSHYMLLSAGADLVGGLMDIPADAKAAGARPGWSGYVGVADVDESAKAVKALGGAIHKAPEDIPGVGRFSVVADPGGATFVLFQSFHDVPATAPAGTPGHFGWHELYAGDLDRDFAFYSKLFGWTKAGTHDMGEMGPYLMFAAGKDPIGGMMKKPKEVPHPFWLYYINVASIDEAIAKTKAAGGQIILGPVEVPGGSWIAQATDPQGAMFAMVAAKR
jgi:hypothetical protein